MRKITIALLTLLLIFGQIVPVFADEKSDGTIDLVNTFYVTTTREDHSFHVPFNRSWFKNDAREYNHDLAKLSLGLATSAFRPSQKIIKEKHRADYNVRSFLDQAGFADLRSDDYDKNPSMYTVSTVIGHQTIGEGDEAFELLAVGICGQGYLDEWESNLTVGTGKNPTGFYSAAHLVYDRVFGYISENHLNGKMKLWISGFSRAAAVSNIAASLLSDSNSFSQESVFAYTFATPMTVRDSDPKLYENIFNVCGKMDPVTNVPFADWGYSRYGITYYTPTMETDSDFWDKRKKADKIYKDLTGISYWGNPDMNSQLRVLIDCLLSICPDVETYNDSLQKHLISLWEKHDAFSVMSKLLEMANDPVLIDEDNRLEANVMMNQIAFLITDYLGDTNAFRRYNYRASVGSNFLQTHTPELYISWIFSVDDPAELYSDLYNYTLLYIEGDANITISRDGQLLESMTSGDNNLSELKYFGVRNEKVSVLIPRDSYYKVTIRSEKNQTLNVFEAGLQVGRHAPEETVVYFCDMVTGDVLNIGYAEVGRELNPEGAFSTTIKDYHTEKNITGIDVLSHAYNSSSSFTWRDMVLVLIIVIVLLVTTILFLITILPMWIRHSYKRKHGFIPKDARFRPLPIICFFLIQQVFIIKEFFDTLYNPSPVIITIFKLIIGLLILIIAFYGYRRTSNHFHLMILYAVLMLTVADIMMTYSVTVGALLYIGSYILLCGTFIKEDRPEFFRIIVWIIVSYLGTSLIFKATADYGNFKYLAALYIITGTALVITGFTHSARVSRGSFLLFVAGILIIITMIKGDNVFLHFASAALHYIAVCILASAGSGFTLPIILPEYVFEPKEKSA